MPYVVALLLAAMFVGVVAAFLVENQQSASRTATRNFTDGPAVSATLAGSLLQANQAANLAFAKATYGGDLASVRAATAVSSRDGSPRTIIRDAQDRVLAFFPATLKPADLVPDQALRTAKLGGRVGYSNLLGTDPQLFHLAMAFTAANGERRIWTTALSVESLADFFAGQLAGAKQVGGGGAVIVDGNGRVVASSRGDKLAVPLATAQLAAALSSAPEGVYDTYSYASAPVPDTPWRVVFTAPTNQLLEAVRSSREITWKLFGLFVVVLGGLLLLAAVAVDRSSRLALERLHDTLTGLPNRALFLAETQEALARGRPVGEVAVLFIDLDRFKAVNDHYGHGVGDALLVAVAARLRASVRSGDVVSRFGGDEFLVLSPDIDEMRDAVATARRVQQALAKPFTIGTNEVSIGSSIGVVLASQLGERDASLMIHAADIAMYQAKRGTIVPYEAQMTAPKY